MYPWHARLVASHSYIWMHLDRAAIFTSRGLVLSVAARDKRENKPQKQKDLKKMARKMLAKLLQRLFSDDLLPTLDTCINTLSCGCRCVTNYIIAFGARG